MSSAKQAEWAESINVQNIGFGQLYVRMLDVVRKDGPCNWLHVAECVMPGSDGRKNFDSFKSLAWRNLITYENDPKHKFCETYSAADGWVPYKSHNTVSLTKKQLFVVTPFGERVMSELEKFRDFQKLLDVLKFDEDIEVTTLKLATQGIDITEMLTEEWVAEHCEKPLHESYNDKHSLVCGYYFYTKKLDWLKNEISKMRKSTLD